MQPLLAKRGPLNDAKAEPALIDPAAARDVPDRIGVDQPDPTAIAVPVPTPTPVPTPVPVVGVAATPPPSTSGGWILDPDVSWYGPGFYGQRTACGLTLTTTLIGVANRTLPCGTLVTFRNPVNGVIVQAPVVDRGPYVTGRQWDLTGGLCLALDHCYTGALEYHIP